MDDEKKKKILIVDDDQPYRETMVGKFRDNGFEVSEATDGQEGLVKALAEKPDLILLDILMPKMDGIALLKELREDEWGRTAVVIMLTNLKDAQKTVEAMEFHVFDYCVKAETDFHKILGRVKHVLGILTQ